MAKKKPVEEEEDEDVDEEEKEEANRLKTLAEEKYKLSNFKSALKYSKRAQRLHPNLQGISDMVTAFNILDIASKASSSDDDDDDGSLPDWYKILEVEPFSHINSIKKQYKKLALILHPDKNTCIASEEAFKHVGEAFRVLSDKIKRKDYDLKFRIALQSQVTVSSDVTPVSRVVDTFWTKCSTCRLFHQFEKRYMGQSLMCPSCKKSFLAVEAVVDDDKTRVKGKGSGGGSSLSEKNDRKEPVGGSENITRKREASDSISDFFDRMGLRSPSNKKAKKIPEMTLAEMQLEETKKRPEKTLAEMQSEAKRKVQSEKGKMKEVAEKAEKIKGEQNKTEEKRTNKEREKVKEKEKEKVKVNEKKGKTNEKEKVKEKVNEKEKVIVNEKKGKVNKKEKEMEKVKEKVMAKEKEKEKVKEKEKEKEKVSENEKGKASEKEKEKEKASMKEKAKEKAKEKEKEKEKEKKEKANEKAKEKEDRHLVTDSGKNRNLEVMAVEDSDFYNFDKDRMERSFKKGQVWAVYDDDDGMPRHYGLIDEVVSANPFEVKMSWLDLQNNTDEGLISWHRSVSISCGRFKVAKKTTIDSVNFFSHPVECERVAREVYRIYPKKGSIWALYRERDLDEDEAEPISGDNRFYDIVVFLTSYSEMHGLSMAYLEKVEGFKTIFKRREIGCHAIRWFEKDNVQLFSHQIPARKLLGKEAPGLPKDSWELDPASLSPDLLIMSGE